MRLLRFAILEVGLGFLQDGTRTRGFSSKLGDIEIRSLGWVRNSSPRRLILVAEQGLPCLPALTPDRDVLVPAEPRRELEAALEHVADLLAIAAGSGRYLSSPSRVVAFRPDDQTEARWLDECRGIAGDSDALAYPGFTVRLGVEHIAALGDRAGGAQILAEALSTDHVTGRFVEFQRLFEHAFRASSGRLVPLLSEFLSAWHLLEYSKREINRWVRTLRASVAHADRDKPILVESDLRPVMSRMSFAAYDLVLNKLSWGDASTDRRGIWQPDLGPISPDGRTIFVRQHSTPAMRTQLLDRFGAFPLNLNAGGLPAPPGSWPERAPTESTADHGEVRVVPSSDLVPVSPNRGYRRRGSPGR